MRKAKTKRKIKDAEEEDIIGFSRFVFLVKLWEDPKYLRNFFLVLYVTVVDWRETEDGFVKRRKVKVTVNASSIEKSGPTCVSATHPLGPLLLTVFFLFT